MLVAEERANADCEAEVDTHVVKLKFHQRRRGQSNHRDPKFRGQAIRRSSRGYEWGKPAGTIPQQTRRLPSPGSAQRAPPAAGFENAQGIISARGI